VGFSFAYLARETGKNKKLTIKQLPAKCDLPEGGILTFYETIKEKTDKWN